VEREGVEPTSNAAERALQWGTLWRRRSFGTQSARGSHFVERILTAVTTLVNVPLLKNHTLKVNAC